MRHPATCGILAGGASSRMGQNKALMDFRGRPLIVQQISDIVAEVNRQGTSVVLVEQNATMALTLADHGYVLENGRVVKDGTGAALLADKDIQEFYLGTGEQGRRSFREIKTYRRKKRWSS
jgi:branched-chain amino acid transport system ATP-binding protein